GRARCNFALDANPAGRVGEGPEWNAGVDLPGIVSGWLFDRLPGGMAVAGGRRLYKPRLYGCEPDVAEQVVWVGAEFDLGCLEFARRALHNRGVEVETTGHLGAAKRVFRHETTQFKTT